MTASGLGVLVLPASILAREGYPTLVAHRLTCPTVERNTSIIVKQGRSLSPAATRFVKLLTGEFGSGHCSSLG